MPDSINHVEFCPVRVPKIERSARCLTATWKGLSIQVRGICYIFATGTRKTSNFQPAPPPCVLVQCWPSRYNFTRSSPPDRKKVSCHMVHPPIRRSILSRSATHTSEKRRCFRRSGNAPETGLCWHRILVSLWHMTLYRIPEVTSRLSADVPFIRYPRRGNLVPRKYTLCCLTYVLSS